MTNRTYITVGDGDVVEAVGMGTLILDGMGQQLVLEGVLYAPEMYTHVLSVSKLTEVTDLCVVFTKFSADIKPHEGSSHTLLKAKKVDGLYIIDLDKNKASVSLSENAYMNGVPVCNITKQTCVSDPANESASSEAVVSAASLSSSDASMLWHQRLGHPSQQMTRKLCESDAVLGIPGFDVLVSAFNK